MSADDGNGMPHEGVEKPVHRPERFSWKRALEANGISTIVLVGAVAGFAMKFGALEAQVDALGKKIDAHLEWHKTGVGHSTEQPRDVASAGPSVVNPTASMNVAPVATTWPEAFVIARERACALKCGAVESACHAQCRREWLACGVRCRPDPASPCLKSCVAEIK